MSKILSYFHGGGSYFSSDIVILISIFVIFFAYALYFGKNRIISLILAFYPAQFLYANFPFVSKLLFLKGDSLLILNKVIIFLVFLIIMDILIGRFVFKESGYGGTHYLRIGGFALAMIIVVLIFTYSVINLDTFHNFSPSIDVLFTGPDRIFYWNLAPLALMFVL